MLPIRHPPTTLFSIDTMLQGIRIIEYPLHEDTERGGKLIPIEHDAAMPFEVKRTYYLMNVPENSTRGAHAHLIEDEVFVCLRGKVTMKFSEAGEEKQRIVLKEPHVGVHVPKLVWHEFCEFSPDAILLCFSSTKYLPGNQNYITKWEDFLEIYSKKRKRIYLQ